MNLRNVRIAPAGDVAKFAWGSLSQFQNVAYVSDLIAKANSLSKGQLKNATKQAEQIRYCLVQAYEYFSAAQSVTMSTRPLLLYYGTMSLALAEILYKGTGDYSLDRARGQHAHHGLDLRSASNPSKLHRLEESAAVLRAAPLIKAAGERFGTFELWHRVARETPVTGKLEKFLASGGRQHSTEAIFAGHDVRLPLPPAEGLTILECFQSHPRMSEVLHFHGVPLHLARAKVEATTHEKKWLT